MNTPAEQLQAMADAWAAKLGGKVKVRAHLCVEAGPQSDHPWYGATIGEPGVAHWSGFNADPDEAQREAEHAWKLDGAPIDPKDAERRKLKARAAQLGMHLVDDHGECECSKKG